ncbi:hypothetical protein DQX05_02000 [Paenibacillus thiaminolyticus]|uniref:Uncharacterized protein n=1 Tax=Paenibacillus thiaminolyticus TaxID=49283 RepID=A0A3A3GSS4_PANTH|nr:hypothetical protein DQX05_02000 [Paenibacillus thiaminolyticus]
MLMIFVENFMLAFGIGIIICIISSISHHPKPEYRFGMHDVNRSFLLALFFAIPFTVIDVLFDL